VLKVAVHDEDVFTRRRPDASGYSAREATNPVISFAVKEPHRQCGIGCRAPYLLGGAVRTVVDKKYFGATAPQSTAETVDKRADVWPFIEGWDKHREVGCDRVSLQTRTPFAGYLGRSARAQSHNITIDGLDFLLRGPTRSGLHGRRPRSEVTEWL
jgi:hypothetical protein